MNWIAEVFDLKEIAVSRSTNFDFHKSNSQNSDLRGQAQLMSRHTNLSTFDIQGVIAQIDLSRPLHRASDDARRREARLILEQPKHTSLKVRPHIKDAPLSIGEHHIKLIIRKRMYSDGFRVHHFTSAVRA
nr:hypothetical protein [Nevskia sp.]